MKSFLFEFRNETGELIAIFFEGKRNEKFSTNLNFCFCNSFNLLSSNEYNIGNGPTRLPGSSTGSQGRLP